MQKTKIVELECLNGLFKFIALSVVDEGITHRERQLQQQANDLKLLQTRPNSEFISAYGFDQGVEAVEEKKVKEAERPKSEIFLSKDIEAKLQSGHTGTMRDRKNRLEKLDLQPVAVEVPKVPDDALKKGERRAPEGEENEKMGQDGLSSPLRNFTRGDHHESQFSGPNHMKHGSSVENLSDSDENSIISSEAKCPSVIRRHPRKNGNLRSVGSTRNSGMPRKAKSCDDDHLKSVVNPNYDRMEGSFNEMPLSRNEISVSRRSLKSESVSPNKSDYNMSSFQMTPKSIHKESPRKSTSLLDEIVARRQSLRRRKSSTSSEEEEDEDEERSNVGRGEDNKAETSICKRDTRENVKKDPANYSRQRSKSHSSFDSILSSYYDDDVFVDQGKIRRSQENLGKGRYGGDGYNHHGEYQPNQKSSGKIDKRTNAGHSNEFISDARPERSYRRSGDWSGEKSVGKLDMRSNEKSSRPSNQKSDGWSSERADRQLYRRSGDWEDLKSHVPDSRRDRKSERRSNRRPDRVSDARSDRTSNRSYHDDSDFDDKWEIDIDAFSTPVKTRRSKSRNDERDDDYDELVNNLTRGRARTSYDDEIYKNDRANLKHVRSKSRGGLYKDSIFNE